MIVKSPSDTTIYTPALKRIQRNGIIEPFINNNRSPQNKIQLQTENNNVSDFDQISSFIEAIRVETGKKQSNELDRNVRGREVNPRDQAKQTAEKLIIEAEQFKAAINQPQGISDNEYFQQGVVKDDDDFFHLTCHIDPGLYAKIEHGEYVDLEKLLPQLRQVLAIVLKQKLN